MAFNPKKDLYPEVYEAYELGALNWMVVVKVAVDKALQATGRLPDLDWLTSVVFYLHHEERKQFDGSYQPIPPGDEVSIAQWKGFRTLIKPLMPAWEKRLPEEEAEENDIIIEGDYTNRLGKRVVENFNKSRHKTIPADCFVVAHRRVQEGAKQVCSVTLPEVTRDTIFGRIWGSYMNPVDTWISHVPKKYRGKGAPGAMAWSGRGKLIDSIGIWSGKLRPGALIQVWLLLEHYYKVRDGETLPGDLLGHSFIFLKYVKSGSAIIGMKVADQGWLNDETVNRSRFGYWVGANIYCA